MIFPKFCLWNNSEFCYFIIFNQDRNHCRKRSTSHGWLLSPQFYSHALCHPTSIRKNCTYYIKSPKKIKLIFYVYTKLYIFIIIWKVTYLLFYCTNLLNYNFYNMRSLFVNSALYEWHTLFSYKHLRRNWRNYRLMSLYTLVLFDIR